MKADLEFRQSLVLDLVELQLPLTLIERICITHDDACLIKDTIELLKPSSILEVGAYMGVSSLFIANLVKDYGTVTSIDPNFKIGADAEGFGSTVSLPSRYFYEILTNKYSINNSIRLDGYFSCLPNKKTLDYHMKYNPQAKQIGVIGPSFIGKNTFDFIFIDGDHYASSVTKDLELAKELIHDESLICLHDAEGFWGRQVLQGVYNFINNNPTYCIRTVNNLVFVDKISS